jgi:Ca2+-binding EF-hand superfamily protein
LREAFKLFDRDGSGEITASEIKAILGSGKKLANEAIFDEIIKEVDVNGDGVISFEEFKQMMQKLFQDPSPQTI